MITLQCLSIRCALVMDDSMLIRHTVCRLLQKYGFEVESATKELIPLCILTRFRPSVNFADLEMPKMVGISSSPLKARLEIYDIPMWFSPPSAAATSRVQTFS